MSTISTKGMFVKQAAAIAIEMSDHPRKEESSPPKAADVSNPDGSWAAV